MADEGDGDNDALVAGLRIEDGEESEADEPVAASYDPLLPLEDSLESSLSRDYQQRIYPRSKAQLLIDAAEDLGYEDEQGALILDLSSLNATRFSSRLFYLASLVSLNLSHNRLKILSSDIQYLVKLQYLDISFNVIEVIPVEIEELRDLRVINMSKNRLSKLPGNFFKLDKLTELYLSRNRFEICPMEIGSLELLKDLREWEVGIGRLTSLEVFSLAHNGISEWPKQLERLVLLQSLDLSNNQLTEISTPHLLKCNGALKHLDLSNNQIFALPSELYSLKLEVVSLAS